MATISDAKQNLTGMVHSTSLTKVKNLYTLMERAMRTVLGKADPPETIRKSEITNAIHSDIYDYSCPDDIKGSNKVVDIRPQLNRGVDDKLRARFAREFDLQKKENTYHIAYQNGEKILRLSKTISPAPVDIHEFDSLTSNGTVAGGDDACNLAIDDLKYVSGGGSLRFNLDGSGTTASIEVTDLTDVDLEDEDERAEFFLRVYMPDEDRITSIELRWGNSAAVYWSQSATSPHDQDSFKKGWNIVRFGWDGATETGTVDPEAIDYVKVIFTYDGTADTDFRLDVLTCSIGEIWDLLYYSRYGFQDSGGTWKEEVEADSDVVVLDGEGYNLWLYECLKLIAQQMQGEDASFDYTFSDNESKEIYKKYRVNHPSQAAKQKSIAYDMSLLRRGL